MCAADEAGFVWDRPLPRKKKSTIFILYREGDLTLGGHLARLDRRHGDAAGPRPGTVIEAPKTRVRVVGDAAAAEECVRHLRRHGSAGVGSGEEA